ncbi:hypothetical protein GMOD_00009148 [Pyrenophora seminiperda CCB06]|uniref:Uncharacterized protein n=1 Tax=Pyrenophora seminiperda CCB06 TaxID=1302712 RepID=A0A3M7MBC1_9PLEO|nr:hypothetical protein GMOD_00009148 [Pyrenophora seminiperda CCB06]
MGVVGITGSCDCDLEGEKRVVGINRPVTTVCHRSTCLFDLGISL